MRSFKRAMGLVVTAVLLLGGQQVTAEASDPPDAVTRLSIRKASQTSLSISWAGTERADDYLVERGTDLAMSSRQVVFKTDEQRITVSGLEPGTLYCFQVRALDGVTLGYRSHKVCQRTVGREGDTSGPTYRVVNYNICSAVCSNWGSRRADAAALVAATDPDVVMLEEAVPDSGMAGAIGGMVQVQAKSGKALLYRADRFSVASVNGVSRTGFLELGAGANGTHRYAVWAELVDRASHQHVVFAGVHLAPGDSASDDGTRREETSRLVAALARLNPRDLPIVVAGDFNSHQGRTFDSVSEVMEQAGLANSYFRAHAWHRGKLNSANAFRLKPVKGATWGYHLDQVWAQPERTQVLQWRNAAKVVSGRYAAPLPSNHSPILVEVRVNG